MRNTALSISSLLSALLFPSNVFAIGLGGGVSGSYEIFEGIIDPFDITINGQTVNTGLVEFTIDDSKPSNFVFDFDNMTHTYEVSLLVTSTNFSSLGVPPQEITVNLTGPITSTVPTDFPPSTMSDVEIFSETLTGGGVFGPGQLLSGWEYSNIQINKTEVTNVTVIIGDDNKSETKCDSNSKAEGSGEIDANLTNPQGTQTIPLTGQGQTSSGNNQLSCPPPKTPEPSPIIGLLAVGGLGIASKLKKKSK